MVQMGFLRQNLMSHKGLGRIRSGGKENLRKRGEMTQRANVLFRAGWISLAIIGVAILVFGLIAATVPTSSDPPYLRAIGVASIGMGLFSLLITTIAYKRRERWAWFALWYYPVFWTAHLVGGLPPGKGHVHQIVFIVLSLTGLLLPVREFFPRRGARAPTPS